MVRLRALASVVPLLDVLLGVVPGSTGIGHGERKQHAAKQRAAQHPAQRFGADAEPDHPRCGDRDDTRENHLAQRRCGGDVDAALGVGLGRAFEQTGDLAELPANLVDHLERRLADRIHRQRAEIERDHPADEDADEHVGVVELEPEVRVMSADGLDERGDDRQRGQGGGANREPLADRRGGVAELVERVGDGASLLAQTAHLRDAPGVVRHGAVGVDRHRDPDRREHADRRHADAVETDQFARHRDDRADGQQGNSDGSHADGKTRDDHGRRSRLGRASDLAHRSAGGEVLGHQPDHDAADRARHHRPPDPPVDADHVGDDVERQQDEQDGRPDGAGAQRHLRLAAREVAHHHDTGDRAQQSEGGEPERQEHQGLAGAEAADDLERHRGGHRNGGDHRAAIRFEDVGAHARHVAHVVADVVRDHSGIARIVLGNARFDLADEIRPDVGALGVDAAADAREQRDAGGAHPEAVNGVRGLGVAAEEQVEEAEAEQTERRDREPHDRPAEECDGERVGRAARMRRGRGAHVCTGCGAHADVAGTGRAQGADDERERGAGAEGEPQHDDEHQTEQCEHLVLAPHEHH